MTSPWAPVAGLSAAATWGAADFAGGYASRTRHPLQVALAVQAIGFVLLLLVGLALREPLPPVADLAWGAAAGLSGILGLLSFYVALASGRMGVAAPVTGVVAASIPVLFAGATLGAPPTLRIVGFLFAFAGIALVSSERGAVSRRQLAFAVLAGLGFAGFLILISRTSGAAFVWPLVAVRVAGGGLVLLLLLLVRPAATTGAAFAVLAAGILDTAGNVAFLAAARLGRLDVAAVLSSLYPAATVLLARGLLGERLTRVQGLGVAVILVAIVLVTWP